MRNIGRLPVLAVLLLMLAMCMLSGCGNKSNGSIGSQPPTITSVTVTSSPPSITEAQTSTCTASVLGTNAYSSAVTWTATGGTITSSGVFTPSGVGTGICTATSQQDSTKSGSANITVTLPIAITAVSVTCLPSSITTAQTSNCSAIVSGTGAISSAVNYSATGGMITSSGVFTPSGVGTATVTATSQQDSTKSGSATITVTTPPPTVTSVTLAATASSITDAQTTTVTPTVNGTGAFANTVNLSVSPTSAGTLSATLNVSSGTAVTFTPAGTGTATATITATSTSDSTKSGSAVIAVTLRTITISQNTNNVWLDHCAAALQYNMGQTGIRAGDTLYRDPSASEVFSTAPPSVFTVGLNLSNTSTPLCSPGAYAHYVTGTDGAKSNTNYLPILDPWNSFAGFNSVDEFQSDYGSQKTCKYKLSDGTLDGCFMGAGLANIVDGNFIVISSLGTQGVGVYSTSDGSVQTGVNPSGSNVTDVAAKNGIVGFTQSSLNEVSFFSETQFSATTYDVASLGTAPASIAMSTGCSSDPNVATSFIYDGEGSTAYRVDATKGSGTNPIASATRVGSVLLNGFSPASTLTTTLARYIVAWDNSCKAAVLAPVYTSSNADSSKNYNMELALIDGTSGSMRQLGTYLVDAKIPATAIRMAADPAGNAVVIASTNGSAGTTILTKVAWTLDGASNPTFTVTTLTSAPPVGVYGVSLGVLPSGKISTGQRQQHSVLANQ